MKSAAEAYYRRLIQWQASAAHSELVSAVYVLEKSGDSAAEVFASRYRTAALCRGRSAGGIRAVVAATQPDAVRRPSRSSASSRGRASAGHADGEPRSLGHGSVGTRLDSFAGRPSGRLGGTSRWLMVELDRQEIEQRLLPELARRNFALSGKFDYNVAVVGGSAGSSGHALYFQPRLYRRTRPGRRSDESFRTARASGRDGGAAAGL